MCPQPFTWAKSERRPAEENLTFKNTTQMNLIDAESHRSEPKLDQEMKENFFSTENWKSRGPLLAKVALE